jgi:hypothetical protein
LLEPVAWKAGTAGSKGAPAGKPAGATRLHPVPRFRAARQEAALHNNIESLNYQLRKVTKARGYFPFDHAAAKLLWLAVINIED